MPKVIKANSKAIRKSVEKAKNIQLAMQAYKDPSSGFSLRAAVLLYGCNKDSITNHLNDISETS
jgi:glutaredoxin-related protein